MLPFSRVVSSRDCGSEITSAVTSQGPSGPVAGKFLPAVVECFDEAGDELFTFLRFPRAQWRGLRTTNALERINEEFRRRTKTQASLPSQDAVLLLLFGLLRSGQIRLRAIDGWQEMRAVKEAA